MFANLTLPRPCGVQGTPAWASARLQRMLDPEHRPASLPSRKRKGCIEHFHMPLCHGAEATEGGQWRSNSTAGSNTVDASILSTSQLLSRVLFNFVYCNYCETSQVSFSLGTSAFRFRYFYQLQ